MREVERRSTVDCDGAVKGMEVTKGRTKAKKDTSAVVQWLSPGITREGKSDFPENAAFLALYSRYSMHSTHCTIRCWSYNCTSVSG